MTDPDVVVLRQKVHGRSAETYADILRDRLPDHEVALARTPAEERDILTRAPVATGIDIDESLVAGSNLDLFACVYAGADHLPLDALADRGVAVTTASGVHGPNISEYVVGALTSFVRGFHRAWRLNDERTWQSFHVDELMGSTVTVVGLGPIGEAVVDRLEPFGVETLGVRYSPEKGGPTDEVFGYGDLHEALARTDHLVLACPLTDETEGLVGEDELLTLPPEATLVNVARGPVVDTDALVDALRWNNLAAAALDVTDPEPLPEDHPLWGFDNVLVTPHNAGHTPRYLDRTADILAENLERAERSGAFEGLKNQVV